MGTNLVEPSVKDKNKKRWLGLIVRDLIRKMVLVKTLFKCNFVMIAT